jgi:hypothetical protein
MVVLTDERYEGLVKMADYHLPHKPNWDSDGCADGNNVWDAYCPKCGAGIDECDNFCQVCGQSIDWSEDKEEK